MLWVLCETEGVDNLWMEGLNRGNKQNYISY